MFEESLNFKQGFKNYYLDLTIKFNQIKSCDILMKK